MGFGIGRAKLWSITETKGKYADCSISTNQKVGEEWKKDFSSKYVRFVGDAFKKLNEVTLPDKGTTITITKCMSQNVYQKDNTDVYLKNDRHIVFDFDWVDKPSDKSANAGANVTDGFMDVPADVSDEIPFM